MRLQDRRMFHVQYHCKNHFPAVQTVPVLCCYLCIHVELDDFQNQLIYLTKVDLYTVALAMRTTIDATGADNWGAVMAMALCSVLPAIVDVLLPSEVLCGWGQHIRTKRIKEEAYMLKVEKKIQSEINRLEQMLYRHRTPVKGWMAKQGYYRHPEEYEMMDGEWEELAKGIHVAVRI